ncbi:aspartic peptidase A1 [Phanerochaete sordida]|uniref:Aspartic peptidase A1 n=1 Tax=Phanerochaete sordida TaxID=48140 RepID=A0A9P3G827_9APHY|nr:aspartic peptidase A1 [Phanerochaete sordida]
MLTSSFLLTVILLALTSTASPVVTVRDSLIRLPFAKRVYKAGLLSLHARDQVRVHHLKALAKAKSTGQPSTHAATTVVSVNATNSVVDYVLDVGVGTPPTTYSLLVDTGSSNTWVGAGQRFVRTSSSVETKDRVSVTYGSGEFSGTEFTDTVTLASGLVIPSQSIGVATRAEGFQGVDGILGIGPTDLTLDTLRPDSGNTVPTVTDNLFSQGTITEDLVAVSFEPTTSDSITNGELTFGGTDSSKFTGKISFAPVTTTSPANEFWGIDETITYGASGTTILAETAGIVDTGTTLLLIASDAFSLYQKATGAVEDRNTGLLRLTTAQFAKLDSLFFNINGTTFEFTANAQAWPRALNTAIGGNTNSVYLVVGNLGTPSGEGLDFVNGQVWLERFYSVFDTTNRRIGFATTSFTNATTN